MKEKIIFCWSSGKDSAFALYELLKSEKHEVVSLLTTVTKGYDRISMHGVRDILLEAQTKSLGVNLEKVYISKKSSNDEYEAKMKETLLGLKALGVKKVGFGDIFLEDLKKYREENLAKVGMKALFPLWKKDTRILSRDFIDLGFKAILTCVDTEKLSGDFCGQEYTKDLLEKLPKDVDSCGENGEFHTFVYEGPIFKERIDIKKGEIVLRDNRYMYCDLFL